MSYSALVATLLFLSLAFPSLAAPYTMNLTCGVCSSSPGYCVSLNGGPFDAQPFTISSTCAEVVSIMQSQLGQDLVLPVVYTVSCGLVCMGCGISASYQSTAKDIITYSVCADSASGQATLSVLNIFYADSQHNRDVEYDWCGQAGCGASSDTGLILGLILGAVGLGVIIAIFIYCKRGKSLRQSSSSSSSKHHSLRTI